MRGFTKMFRVTASRNIVLPPGLLQGLPREDQNAIRGILGKPVLLEEYDEDGRAVLAFADSKGIFHSIFVSPSYIRAHG
jgi:hypothetical protein